jgi:hypothetical protein
VKGARASLRRLGDLLAERRELSRTCGSVNASMIAAVSLVVTSFGAFGAHSPCHTAM